MFGLKVKGVSQRVREMGIMEVITFSTSHGSTRDVGVREVSREWRTSGESGDVPWYTDARAFARDLDRVCVVVPVGEYNTRRSGDVGWLARRK